MIITVQLMVSCSKVQTYLNFKKNMVICVIIYYLIEIKGVLLYRGYDTMVNVKLSCSKHLTVRKINKHGITADVNLLVDVSNMFKPK